MTREAINKHWEVIKAFKDGADIEFRNYDKEAWRSLKNPDFLMNSEYRIKPKFEPKLYDMIMVSNDNKRWYKRLFLKESGCRYICLSEDGKSVIINKSNAYLSAYASSWAYANPLDC